MIAKPRLLVLSHFLPFPPHGGAAIRTFNLLKGLSERFDVTVVAVARYSHQASSDDLERSRIGFLTAVSEVHVVREERPTRVLQGLAQLRSILSGRPYTAFGSPFRELRQLVSKLLSERKFDLVHVDAIDLAPLLGILPLDITILNHHNVESQLLHRRAAMHQGPLRLLLRKQAELIERQEREWIPRVALNVAVSQLDSEKLNQYGPARTTLVAPNGADTEYYRPAPGTTLRHEVVFVGGLSWFPNRDALEYYSAEILPLLLPQFPDLITTWVGKATDEDKRNPKFEGVTLTGYVSDVREYVARAACVVVPLRVGGGTRLKIVEAWAQGKAIVSTSAGCEGLLARHGENILIADEPQDFAVNVAACLTDHDLARSIGHRAWETALSRYSWGGICGELASAYVELLEDHLAGQQGHHH